jgi:hypothetical protein
MSHGLRKHVDAYGMHLRTGTKLFVVLCLLEVETTDVSAYCMD